MDMQLSVKGPYPRAGRGRFWTKWEDDYLADWLGKLGLEAVSRSLARPPETVALRASWLGIRRQEDGPQAKDSLASVLTPEERAWFDAPTGTPNEAPERPKIVTIELPRPVRGEKAGDANLRHSDAKSKVPHGGRQTAQEEGVPEGWLSMSEAVAIAGCSRTTLLKACKQGTVRSHQRLDRNWCIERASLARFAREYKALMERIPKPKGRPAKSPAPAPEGFVTALELASRAGCPLNRVYEACRRRKLDCTKETLPDCERWIIARADADAFAERVRAEKRQLDVLEESFVTVKAYAEASGCALNTIQRMCYEGRIPGCQKRGGQWRIPKAALDALKERIADRKAEAALDRAFEAGHEPGWGPDEDAKLLDMRLQGLSWSVCGSRLGGRSGSSCARRHARLTGAMQTQDAGPDVPGPWTAWEDCMLRERWSTMSARAIADLLPGRTEAAVSARAKKLRLVSDTRKRGQSSHAAPREGDGRRRRCHDCGRPTFDYRCSRCWAKLRSKCKYED